MPCERRLFPPGAIYAEKSGLRSHTTIYLERGAVIQATDSPDDYPHGCLLYFSHLTDARLADRGLLEGNGRTLRELGASVHFLEIAHCRQCRVDGVLQRDSSYWANHFLDSSDIHFTNLKILNYRPPMGMNNADGLNFDTSRNCSLYNGLICTGDDNCVVKGTVADGVSENIVSERYVGYSNSAACKVGTETENRTMSHIRFAAVDIVSCDRAAVINGYDHAHIHDVVFEDICVENIAPQGMGAEPSRLIEFEITDDTWRPCAGQCRVSDVLCREWEIRVEPQTYPSLLSRKSEPFGFQNIQFQRLYLQGPDGRRALKSCADLWFEHGDGFDSSAIEFE